MAIGKSEFTFAATGDAIITEEVLQQEGYSDRFDKMLETIRNPDVTLTHLETLLHDFEEAPADTTERIHMRSHPRVVDELLGMGCDLFSTASNHTFDYARHGIRSTIDELDSRDARFAGIGHNLFEARKPTYFQSPAGSVALLSTCSSFSLECDAGPQTEALQGRPGLNPLHVEQIYKLPEKHFDSLLEISQVVGVEAIKHEESKRDLYTEQIAEGTEIFEFGESTFQIVEEESEAGIDYVVDEADKDSNLEWISEADENADWVVMAIHSHQGANGFRNTETTPEFLIEFAHNCIDTGADIVVGTGPHKLRGIEIYDGKPIFYSLGNFVSHLDSLERYSEKIYNNYGLDDYTRISQIFKKWFRDDEGNSKGYLAEDSFWQSCIPICYFDEENDLEEIELHPITLQRDQPISQRGTPLYATEEEASAILDKIEELSIEFGTEIERDGRQGIISFDE
jgi:poly-gamma-glutamate synthesis protein (capsule biosynthesis protein)